MKKYFLTILSILSFFTISAQESGENALFLKENYLKTYTEIKSFAEDKWDGNNNMIVHEINKQANSAMYFNTITETVDRDVLYSAIKKQTENGLIDWSMVEYEYKKQFKKSLVRAGTVSDFSKPYINVNTQKKTHREEYGLIGDVKSIKETSYIEVEKFGETLQERDREEKYLEKDFYFLFNRRGNKIQEYKYEPDGSLYSEYKYKYNSKGNIKVCKGTASLMSFLVPTEYYYFYEYDSNENIILESHFQSSDLNLTYSYTYEYDIDNNRIEGNQFKSNGSLESKSIHTYNEKGDEIEVNHFNSDGDLKYKTKYNYDDKGNLIQWNRYEPDGSIAYRGAFKYDIYGNIIEGGGYTYTYEYDQKGNWILRVEFSDNVAGHIIEREIEYFQ